MIPIIFLQHGLTQTQMGFIIGSSALFGALFDIILAKILPSTHYRQLYLLFVCTCFTLVFLLWNAATIPMFFAVTAVWGLFYNFLHMGNFDFVSRETQPQEHASSFGVLNVFKALGMICAPLALALTFQKAAPSSAFLSALLWAGFSMGAFALLLTIKDRHDQHRRQREEPHYKKMNFLLELHIWKKLGVKLFPVLMFTLLIGIHASFFWTLAPLLTEQLKDNHFYGSFFIPMYIFPTLLVGWFVGPVTKMFGKKNTAYWFYIAGALVMLCIAFIHKTEHIVLLGFLSSLFGAFSIPAISGAYADYLSEAPQFDKEIESIEDFFTNIGSVIGPIGGGILADIFGIKNAFALFSVFAICLTLWVIKASPKKITITS